MTIVRLRVPWRRLDVVREEASLAGSNQCRSSNR